MKKVFCILLVATVFSGCFDSYFYIIPLKDNSYIISQRVSFGLEVLKALNSLSSMDSTLKNTQRDSLTPKQMMDTMLMSEFRQDHRFDTIPGYLRHTIRDSLFDTTAFFILEIHVKSADDVPGFLRASQSEKDPTAGVTFDLKISHQKELTKFDFAAVHHTPSGNNADLGGLAELEGGGIHLGVLSDHLVPPEAKSPVKPIPGGAEWHMTFESLKNWDKVKTKKVEFVVRN